MYTESVLLITVLTYISISFIHISKKVKDTRLSSILYSIILLSPTLVLTVLTFINKGFIIASQLLMVIVILTIPGIITILNKVLKNN